MRVFLRLALLAAFASIPLATLPTVAIANQSAPAAPAATADPALTARFTAFLGDILSGRLPSSGVTDTMKAAFTPAAISQLQSQLSPLGSFQRLEYSHQDSVQGYTRYHYVAVFEKGTFPVIFVTDSSQNIAGFFIDQGQ